MDSGLVLSKKVYAQIADTVGMYPPERGGILGAKEGGAVTEFYFDAHGASTTNGYAPNVGQINELLVQDWMPRGILMIGIVHSHAEGNTVPSCGDIAYGIRILQALDTVEKFYLPIVTKKDCEMRMDCYVIHIDPERHFVCQRVTCSIIDD